MNQQLTVQFEVVKGERKYIFLMPTSAPLGETYDACFEVLQEIVKISQDAASKAQRVEEKKAEVVE